MPAVPEQPQRRIEAPTHGGGIISHLYDIETATGRVQEKLRGSRVGMLDETSSPKASQLLEQGIDAGIQGGMLRGKTLMIQTLRTAGKSEEEIGDLLKVYDHLDEVLYGKELSPTQTD